MAGEEGEALAPEAEREEPRLAIAMSVEPVPGLREVVLDVEEPQAGAGQVLLRGRVGGPAQHVPTLACRVVEVQDGVAQRVEVELVVLWLQLHSPAADSTRELERQVARPSRKLSSKSPESFWRLEVAMASVVA